MLPCFQVFAFGQFFKKTLMKVFLSDITPTVMGILFFSCLFLTRIYRSFSRYFHICINGQIIQVDIIRTFVAALSPVDLGQWFVIFICTSFYVLLTLLSRQGYFPSGFMYFSGSDLQQRVLIFFAYNNDVLQRLDEPWAWRFNWPLNLAFWGGKRRVFSAFMLLKYWIVRNNEFSLFNLL